MKKKKPFMQWFFKGFWPYWLGAILLGVLNILLTLIYRPFGITGNFTYCGLQSWSVLGGHPEQLIEYFNEIGMEYFLGQAFYNEATIVNLGILFGAFVAVVLGSGFRYKKIKSRKQLLIGITGGLLMGYGALIALGCNLGALIGGIASQSLHGWIFALFAFFGSLAGCVILQKLVKQTKV